MEEVLEGGREPPLSGEEKQELRALLKSDVFKRARKLIEQEAVRRYIQQADREISEVDLIPLARAQAEKAGTLYSFTALERIGGKNA